MKMRIQLVENGPKQCIPSVFVNIHRTQYIFNVVPALLRHRKLHKLNLFNSSHIFFTKNCIQAIGGLANFLLFRSGVEKSNYVIANKVQIYGNNQIYAFMEKLRFKLGYKILRVSYCNWDGSLFRYGISNISVFDQIRNSPQLFKIFIKIQQYLKQKTKKFYDYYDSSRHMSNTSNSYITLPIFHYHSDLIDIYPIQTKQGTTVTTHYLCLPAVLVKNQDIHLQQFLFKSQITKQNQIKSFIKNGYIKNAKGQQFRKNDFKVKENLKPKNVMILHHTTIQSLIQLMQNQVMINYFQNGNKTSVVVHIVQDLKLLKQQSFRNFINKFQGETSHIWYNQQLITSDSLIPNNLEQQYLSEHQVWSSLYPSLFKDLQLQKMNYYAQNNSAFISNIFPSLKTHLYKRLFNYIKNDYLGDTYTNRKQVMVKNNRIDIIKQLIGKENCQHQSIITDQPCTQVKENQYQPKVSFFGTSSSMPTANRNTLGIFVSLCNKVNFLLDCGDGTYQQLIDHIPKESLQQQLLKLRVIFISHIHSDHNLGILHLIHERNKLMKKYGVQQKVYLIIPFNVYNWYYSFNQTFEDLSVGCQVLFTQVILDETYQQIVDQKLQSPIYDNLVNEKSLKNRWDNKGKNNYCRTEKNEDTFYSQLEISAKTKQIVLKELPNQKIVLASFLNFLKVKQYKSFEAVRVFHCPQSFGVVIEHKNQMKVSYSGDTRPFQIFKEKAANSTLLIHESTFNDIDSTKAVDFRHSTISEAIKVGKDSCSNKLVVTHFNQDFDAQLTPQILKNSKQFQQFYKKNVIVSLDHLQINLNKMQQLPGATQRMAKLDAQAKQIMSKEKQDILQKQYKRQ